MMQAVLVSACLLGQPVRYDGRTAVYAHPVLARWSAEGRIVPLCPEGAGGLPTPRPAAEIEPQGHGGLVVQGLARVRDRHGADVTAAFLAGARHACAVAAAYAIRLAVLKEGSPSCGSGYIYDGWFQGKRVAAQGVTSASLVAAGVRVFSEHELDAADAFLRSVQNHARQEG